MTKILTESFPSYTLHGVLDSIKTAVTWLEGNPHPDLIFMDIQLSDTDGMQITESIRADSSIRPDLPIIALTAHVFKQEQAKFINSGMNASLAKPISRQVLYTTLCQWLNCREKQVSIS